MDAAPRPTATPAAANLPKADLLPPIRACSTGQVILIAIRRMAANGIHDAASAALLLAEFGQSYRRPLVLLRAMMLEMSRASTRKIILSAACCRRMTTDEARLLRALALDESQLEMAHDAACRLTGRDEAPGLASCLLATGQCLRDLGKPIR